MLNKISHELKTQDNRATKNPIFILYDHERVPSCNDYTDTYMYSYYNDGDYTGFKDRKGMIEFIKKNNIVVNEPIEVIEQMEDQDFDFWIDGEEYFGKLYYIKKKVFIQAFFTEKGAKEYLEANKRKFAEPEIYVETLSGNKEMIFIRDMLLDKKFCIFV